MILLFSGGIDSFVAYHYLNKPETIYFYLRSRYSEKEIGVIEELVPNTIIDYSLDFSTREYGDKAYIPFRNLILACQAVKYDDHVVIAGLADDKVSDKNESIFKEFSDLLTKLEGRPITVTSPFWNMTKSNVVKWFIENYPEERELLTQTVSCYDENPFIRQCWKCPACFRKWSALRINGFTPPFYNRELLQTYLKAAERGEYIPQRNAEIIKVVTEYLS